MRRKFARMENGKKHDKMKKKNKNKNGKERNKKIENEAKLIEWKKNEMFTKRQDHEMYAF